MLRSLWPAGLITGLIFLSALTFGADQPAASLFLSAIILGVSALLLLTGRSSGISDLGLLWMVGALLLFGIALLRGWAVTGAPEYASLIAGAGLFMVTRNAGREPARAEALWTLTLALGAGLGLIAFVDFMLDPRTMFGVERPYHVSRLSGPFFSANTAATFYGVIGLMALASLIRAVKRGGRADARLQRLALPAATVLICASCLFLSGSRAGVTLFMLSAIALLVWDQLETWRSALGRKSSRPPAGARNALLQALVGPGVLITLGLIIFGISGGLYADRIETGGLLVSENARAVMFARYLDAIGIAPVLGAGLGGFGFINDFLATTADARLLTSQNAAHNILFQWLLQTGLLGTLPALSLLAAMLWRLNSGLRRRRSQTLMIRTTLIIAGFVTAHGMVDYALEIPTFFWLFTFVLALGVGIAEGGRSARKTSTRWLIRAPVIVMLTAAAGLSIVAGLDHASAVRTASLSDEAFRLQYASESALSGSATRLEAIGDRALRLETPEPALARAAFVASLDREDRNGKVWAKLAYANYAIIPVIAGETEDALRRSYYRMPYADRSFIDWRLDFMARVWSGLPEDLRSAAERESRVLSDWEQRRWRRQIASHANES